MLWLLLGQIYIFGSFFNKFNKFKSYINNSNNDPRILYIDPNNEMYQNSLESNDSKKLPNEEKIPDLITNEKFNKNSEEPNDLIILFYKEDLIKERNHNCFKFKGNDFYKFMLELKNYIYSRSRVGLFDRIVVGHIGIFNHNAKDLLDLFFTILKPGQKIFIDWKNILVAYDTTEANQPFLKYLNYNNKFFKDNWRIDKQTAFLRAALLNLPPEKMFIIIGEELPKSFPLEENLFKLKDLENRKILPASKEGEFYEQFFFQPKWNQNAVSSIEPVVINRIDLGLNPFLCYLNAEDFPSIACNGFKDLDFNFAGFSVMLQYFYQIESFFTKNKFDFELDWEKSLITVLANAAEGLSRPQISAPDNNFFKFGSLTMKAIGNKIIEKDEKDETVKKPVNDLKTTEKIEMVETIPEENSRKIKEENKTEDPLKEPIDDLKTTEKVAIVETIPEENSKKTKEEADFKDPSKSETLSDDEDHPDRFESEDFSGKENKTKHFVLEPAKKFSKTNTEKESFENKQDLSEEKQESSEEDAIMIENKNYSRRNLHSILTFYLRNPEQNTPEFDNQIISINGGNYSRNEIKKVSDFCLENYRKNHSENSEYDEEKTETLDDTEEYKNPIESEINSENSSKKESDLTDESESIKPFETSFPLPTLQSLNSSSKQINQNKNNISQTPPTISLSSLSSLSQSENLDRNLKRLSSNPKNAIPLEESELEELPPTESKETPKNAIRKAAGEIFNTNNISVKQGIEFFNKG